MTGMQNRALVIAIDGPSASGKSTIGKMIAARLGLKYIDTGAMYRAIAWMAKQNNISWHNENELVFLLETSKIIIGQENNQTYIKIEDYLLKDQLRTQEIGKGASIISALKRVKLAMIEKQRDIAKGGGIVMDGRDIGTYVFPDADIKFYIHANLDTRARRRYKELEETSKKPVFETIFQEIKDRDDMDMNRKTAPLKTAPDAISIDTTDLSIAETCDLMLKEIDTLLNTSRDKHRPHEGHRGE
ncbi:MAG: (d)CMP kinase [bacterium]